MNLIIRILEALLAILKRIDAARHPQPQPQPPAPAATPTPAPVYVPTAQAPKRPPPVTASRAMTRAQRNNNPGNLDRAQQLWLGELRTPAAMALESRFAVFSTPQYGYRALGKLLLNYQRVYGLRSVRGIINRWAPAVENNTSAYVTAVSAAMGVLPDAEIDLGSVDMLAKMAKAIAHHESGFDPWPDDVLRAGIAMIVPKP